MISFIDNSSGFFALKKGYCKDEAICNLIAVTWRIISKMGWHLHLEWVASQLNISDKVSRQSLEEMHQIQADQDRVQTDDLFRTLEKVAIDHDYTYGSALQDILAIPLPNLQNDHTGGVEDLAPVWQKGIARCGDMHRAETESNPNHGQKDAAAVQPFWRS